MIELTYESPDCHLEQLDFCQSSAVVPVSSCRKIEEHTEVEPDLSTCRWNMEQDIAN